MMNYTYRAQTPARPLYRGVQVVWYILGVLEALLVLRFFLRLLAANPGAGFTNFMYAVTYPLVEPFQAVFGVSHVAGSAFEWTTLLAMFVYYLIAFAIIRLLSLGRPVSEDEARYSLREEV